MFLFVYDYITPFLCIYTLYFVLWYHYFLTKPFFFGPSYNQCIYLHWKRRNGIILRSNNRNTQSNVLHVSTNICVDFKLQRELQQLEEQQHTKCWYLCQIISLILWKNHFQQKYQYDMLVLRIPNQLALPCPTWS